MVLSRNAAYSTIVGIALVTYAFAAYASLWVAPQALGLATPAAFARFQEGSTSGIQLFTIGWTMWSFACLAIVLIRVKNSDAWIRRGRHRFISLGGAALMVYGLIGTSSWMVYLQVDLAMEHVTPWTQRDGSAGALFQPVWVSAAWAIFAALALGAIGAEIDRRLGKSPLLAAA